jgi:hypothetical protein
MFKRRIEIHQEEAFEGLEAAKQYADKAPRSKLRYQAFLERLKSLLGRPQDGYRQLNGELDRQWSSFPPRS